MSPKYPGLPANLKEQLREITPSVDGELKYYPCRVWLTDGTEIDRVYVVSEIPYIRHWGVYPSQDRGKSEVQISEVVSLAESASRLPARFANELYRTGESGMGYTIFTVVFRDLRQAYLTGNAVDFIEYPASRGPEDVIAVLPHVGRDSGYREGLNYSWCLYSE